MSEKTKAPTRAAFSAPAAQAAAFAPPPFAAPRPIRRNAPVPPPPPSIYRASWTIFPPPAMQEATVQRLATDSIAQPGAAVRSAIVPDLTTALVDQIQAANTAVLRQQALDALLASLQASGAVDDPGRTEIRYVHQNNANAAVTRVTGMEDDDPIRITVYRNGYDAGPAALYSTVRHELIHVAQRLLVPDEDNAQFDDNYMHENIYDQDVGVATRDTIQIPLQEIETHAWELIHAGETGVNAAYSQQTVTDLVAYAQTLTASVQAVELNTFIYWHDYLAKAVILLVDANAAHDSLLIRNAADALAAAVEERSDEAA